MKKILLLTLFCFTTITACTSKQYFENRVKPAADFPPAEDTMAIMEKVANWQLPRLTKLDYVDFKRENAEAPRQWMQGTFFTGLTSLAERSTNPVYDKWIQMTGEEWEWQLGDRPFHGDDHLVGYVYLKHFMRNGGEHKYKPTQERFDMILANRPTNTLQFAPDEDNQGEKSCQKRWCWADALFMAPPTWFALSKATGDPKYANYANEEFQATINYLYDPEIQLVFRDSRYKNKKGEFGEPVFWARGSGWVLGGLVRTMNFIPNDHPDRQFYVDLYRNMVQKLKALQKADGTWAMSLLAKDKMPLPETSGTAFFTYGIAWGIKHGVISKKEYWPVVSKGWAALQSSVHPDGKLGWVQRVGAEPGKVAYDDSQIYGVGAFLLAGSIIYDLDKSGISQ